MSNRYEYEELRAAAIAPDAKQEDVDALAEWFERYGDQFWNGESYDADGVRLYPVYKETADGDFEIVCYEIR